jgi:hypothetical protein
MCFHCRLKRFCDSIFILDSRICQTAQGKQGTQGGERDVKKATLIFANERPRRNFAEIIFFIFFCHSRHAGNYICYQEEAWELLMAVFYPPHLGQGSVLRIAL